MTIEERIERLERMNRRYRLMFMLLGVLIVCAVGISATQDDGVPDVIRAKAFEVVDDEGTKFVEILRNDALKRDGGVIRMNTKSTQGLVAIYSVGGFGTDQGVLHLTSTGQEDMLILGAGSLAIVDEETRRNMAVSIHASGGSGWLSMSNKEGQRLITLQGTGDGGHIEVRNKTGEPVCVLRVDEYGNGEIGAFDRNGKGRTLKPGPQ